MALGQVGSIAHCRYRAGLRAVFISKRHTIMEHNLSWWKGRALDLEELVFLETDRETLKILLMAYAEAIYEIQIHEIYILKG